MDRREALKGLAMSLGYVVATPTLVGVLNSCQSTEQPWVTLYFDRLEKRIVPVLVDVILPAGDTPGGLDIDLPKFADMMVKEVWSKEKQESFRQGIQLFAKKLGIENNDEISDLKSEEIKNLFRSLFEVEGNEKEQLLELIKRDQKEVKEEELNTYLTYSSLMELRNLLLLGYFSSEKIGREVLTFDPIPGQYKACMPVSEVGNSYSI